MASSPSAVTHVLDAARTLIDRRLLSRSDVDEFLALLDSLDATEFAELDHRARGYSSYLPSGSLSSGGRWPRIPGERDRLAVPLLLMDGDGFRRQAAVERCDPPPRPKRPC